MDAQIERAIEVTRNLYYETHIVPSEQDFLSQINNVPLLFLVLYWLKKEHLYEPFLDELMDLESISLMKENDFEFFKLEDCEQFQAWAKGLRV
jgi:hypothetical protein